MKRTISKLELFLVGSGLFTAAIFAFNVLTYLFETL